MSFPELLLIAFSLSMDCFAVALSLGVVARMNWKESLTVAVSLGLFQGIMPLFGWLAGSSLNELISSVDHWIAFAILAIIGIKMIVQSFSPGEKYRSLDIRNLRILLVLSVATSIDALITRIGFGFIEVPILPACLLITLVTFLVTLIGCKAGARALKIKPRYAEILGGVVLIGIGIRIVMDHVGLL